MERNFDVWGDTFSDDELMTPAERNITSFDEAKSQLETYILERADWMDRNIDTLRHVQTPSVHTKPT